MSWAGIKAWDAVLEVRPPLRQMNPWHRVFRAEAMTGDWFKGTFVPRTAKTSKAFGEVLIRGARQVGKSYLVREFGRKNFHNVVELNFEMRPDLARIFSGSLDPKQLLRDIKIASDEDIRPGETLLFFDEVQLIPQALTALRYF